MVSKKISEMTAASALTGTEISYSDDGVHDVRVTEQQRRDFALKDPVLAPGRINAASFTVGSAFIANGFGIYHTGTINAVSYNALGLTANSTGVYANSVVNALSFTGAGFKANTSGLFPGSNSLGINLGNTIARWVLTGNSVALSGGLTSDTVDVVTSVNSALITVGTGFIANTLGVYTTGVVNAASHTGAGFTANSLGVYANSVVNAALHSVGTAFTANATVVNAASLTINTTNVIANTLGVYTTGTVNAAVHSTTGLVINATAVTATSNTILLGNSIGRFVITANSADIGPNFVANTLGAYHTATMNAAVHSTTGVVINATAVTATSNTILLGNTIGRFVITANSADIGPGTIANTLGVYATTVNAATHSVGATFTANATLVLAPAINCTAQINTATFFATTTANVGTIQINTIAFAAGSNCFVNTIAVRAPNTGLITNTTAAANGFTFLTGGVLMQWGWVAATSTGVQATFPIAFPTTLFQATVTQVNATPLVNSVVSISSSNTTQITVKTGNATATNCSWIALGN